MKQKFSHYLRFLTYEKKRNLLDQTIPPDPLATGMLLKNFLNVFGKLKEKKNSL